MWARMTPEKRQKRFAILDRDGTIIVEKNYLADPEQVELLPGAAAGLRMMQAAGLGLIVVTNQSGIGRGYFDQHTLHLIHARLAALLSVEEITLDGVYFCPHLPADRCQCRKPATGLVMQAAQEHEFNPSDSFVIGDKLSDLQFGRNIGAVTILTRSGYGTLTEQERLLVPDYVVDDLTGAARIIGRILTEVVGNAG